MYVPGYPNPSLMERNTGWYAYAPDKSLRLRFLVREQRYSLQRRRTLFGLRFYREIDRFRELPTALQALDIEYHAQHNTPGYPAMVAPEKGDYHYQLEKPTLFI
jgi:hypothetical protein